MKFMQINRTKPDSESSSKLGRRGLVVGAGVAGVAAVAAHALHRGVVQAPVSSAAKAVTGQGDGYQLTPHVLRYYETTKA